MPALIRVLSLCGAATLLLAMLWCLLWVFSSSHLAFVACDGKFSLFAESFRCKQPYIAMILATVSLLGSVALAWLALRGGSSDRDSGEI